MGAAMVTRMGPSPPETEGGNDVESRHLGNSKSSVYRCRRLAGLVGAQGEAVHVMDSRGRRLRKTASKPPKFGSPNTRIPRNTIIQTLGDLIKVKCKDGQRR